MIWGRQVLLLLWFNLPLLLRLVLKGSIVSLLNYLLRNFFFIVRIRFSIGVWDIGTSISVIIRIEIRSRFVLFSFFKVILFGLSIVRLSLRLGLFIEIGLILHPNIFFNVVCLKVCQLVHILFLLFTNHKVFEGFRLFVLNRSNNNSIILALLVGLGELCQSLLPIFNFQAFLFRWYDIFFFFFLYDLLWLR